jgi:hypothetical protein
LDRVLHFCLGNLSLVFTYVHLPHSWDYRCTPLCPVSIKKSGSGYNQNLTFHSPTP